MGKKSSFLFSPSFKTLLKSPSPHQDDDEEVDEVAAGGSLGGIHDMLSGDAEVDDRHAYRPSSRSHERAGRS